MHGKLLNSIDFVSAFDPEVAGFMGLELQRQQYGL